MQIIFIIITWLKFQNSLLVINIFSVPSYDRNSILIKLKNTFLVISFSRAVIKKFVDGMELI